MVLDLLEGHRPLEARQQPAHSFGWILFGQRGQASGVLNLLTEKVPFGKQRKILLCREERERNPDAADLQAHHVESRVHLDEPSGAAAAQKIDLPRLEMKPARDPAGYLGGIRSTLDGELCHDRTEHRVSGEASAQGGGELLAHVGVRR